MNDSISDWSKWIVLHIQVVQKNSVSHSFILTERHSVSSRAEEKLLCNQLSIWAYSHVQLVQCKYRIPVAQMNGDPHPLGPNTAFNRHCHNFPYCWHLLMLMLITLSASSYVQDFYFVWQTQFVTSRTVSRGSKQRSDRRCSNLPWVGVHAFRFSVLQLTLRSSCSMYGGGDEISSACCSKYYSLTYYI
jgi:hypothetical protein